jgi:AraC-like DNA-binding protein
MVLSDYDIECLKNARAIIDSSNLHRTIEEIAHSVGMGATRLKAGFKLYYGSGLYAYLREQRMQRARQMLTEGKKTIKTIAAATGYKHTSNFTSAFKRRFNKTPAALRRAFQIPDR